jgi:hypothetical protein
MRCRYPLPAPSTADPNGGYRTCQQVPEASRIEWIARYSAARLMSRQTLGGTSAYADAKTRERLRGVEFPRFEVKHC